ncbi:MFS transporter [Modicisalibacter radicis]|uniref:MFS transporter n=1 Tax=Halomonas sp. EAR18 TaxID=2518972 RepID=UPI00109CE6B5|nr:MFS transporter [Halomonas sp. EAR18]
MTNIEHAELGTASASYRWWILTAAVTAQTTAAVSTQGIGVLGGFIQEDLQLSNASIGLLAGVLNVAPILGLLLAGEWLDRVGECLVIGIGALIMGLAMILSGFITTFSGLLICLFFVGVGYSTAQPGGTKAVFHWFPVRERGLAMGIRQAGLPLGGVVAAAIFPRVASQTGWQTAFLVGACIIIGGGALFCMVYRLPSGVSSRKEPSHHPRRQLIAYARMLLTRPTFRLAVLAGVVLITVQTVALMFLALYLRDRFELPLGVGASHLLVMQLTGAVGRVLLATWSDHLHRGRTVIVLVTAAGSLLGLGALGLFPGNWDHDLLYIASAWLGFFGFGWYGPWVAWISELSPRHRLGATLGIAMAINQVAIVGTPILFGSLVDALGSYIVPGGLLVTIVLIYTVYAGLRTFKKVEM